MDNNYKNKIKKIGNEYVIDFIKTINKKRIHIYKSGFTTYIEASNYLPIELEKRLNETNFKGSRGKYIDFYKSFLKWRSRKINKSTLISIKTSLKSYENKYGDMKVDIVFSLHNILVIYRELIEKKNITEKSKNRILGEFRLMVDYALFLKLITPETASDDKMILQNIPTSKVRKEKEHYDINQINKFLSVIKDNEDKDLFTLFIYLGARISEFIGLTWDTYDPINKTIEIKQQVLYLQEGKPILTDRLKTKESYRKCKLNNEIYLILENRKKRNNKGYIFPRDYKTPYISYPKTKLREKMIKYMKLADLPIISAHGFRHSKATMFMSVCNNMAEVKAAARFLGHSVSMMIDTYAHEEEKTIEILLSRLTK